MGERKMKSQIAPLLSVRRGKEAVEFYEAAFGAEELWRVESPDGEVVARMAVEGAEFWVADESPEYKNFSPETLGGATTRIVLTVEDPDAMYARAVKAGATVVSPVQVQDHGWRQGRGMDAYGHHWGGGRPLKDWCM